MLKAPSKKLTDDYGVQQIRIIACSWATVIRTDLGVWSLHGPQWT